MKWSLFLAPLTLSDMIKSLLLKEKESGQFVWFLVCVLHSGSAVFQFMRVTYIYNIYIRGALTLFTQEPLQTCSRRSCTAVTSCVTPTPAPAHLRAPHWERQPVSPAV